MHSKTNGESGAFSVDWIAADGGTTECEETTGVNKFQCNCATNENKIPTNEDSGMFFDLFESHKWEYNDSRKLLLKIEQSENLKRSMRLRRKPSSEQFF